MRQEHQDQERGKNDRSGEVKPLWEGQAIKCGGKRTKETGSVKAKRHKRGEIRKINTGKIH